MIHGVSKQSESLPSVRRTPIKAGNKNCLSLPTRMQAGHLDPAGRWAGRSRTTKLFMDHHCHLDPVCKGSKKQSVYATLAQTLVEASESGRGLVTALTWRWKLEK